MQETLQPTFQEGAGIAALPAVHDGCIMRDQELQRNADSGHRLQALERHVITALAIHQAIGLAGRCQHFQM